MKNKISNLDIIDKTFLIGTFGLILLALVCKMLFLWVAAILCVVGMYIIFRHEISLIEYIGILMFTTILVIIANLAREMMCQQLM